MRWSAHGALSYIYFVDFHWLAGIAPTSCTVLSQARAYDGGVIRREAKVW